LSLPHVVSLYVLDKGAKSMTELAAALRLSLAATSQLVDKLVENRFVERTEALEDRRFKTVRLRPAGRRTLKSLHRARHLELSATVAKLPRAVQRELAHALAAALTHLETP
jgi:DNA-binding MarR family transcriptional regulator